MRKPYVPDDHDDINQNYSGSLIRGYHGGARCAVKVVGDSSEFLDVNGERLNLFRFQTAKESGLLDFSLPSSRIVNVNGVAFWVSRRVSRQWKRGVRDQNTRAVNLQDALTENRSSPSIFRHFLVDEGFPSIPEAFEQLVKKNFWSVGISHDLAMARQKYLNWPVLYFQTTPIGVCPSPTVVRLAEAYSYLVPKLRDHFEEVSTYDGE